MKYHKKDEYYVVKANGEWIKNAVAGITTINFNQAEIFESESEALHSVSIFSAKLDSEFVIQKLTTEETDPFNKFGSGFVKASKVIF